MDNSLIETSVVISTHNRAELLKCSVASVLEQDYRDFELIIVDDASSDNTPEVVKALDDRRVRYVRHATNKGGPAARNTGIKKARGRFIALLDDDDMWLPGKIEKQMAAIKQASPKVGVIYTGMEIFDQDRAKVIKSVLPAYRGQVYERLLLSNILSLSSALIRKECFDKAGLFDEELTSCQDWDMWLRIARHYEFDFIPELFVRNSVHGKQISNDYQSLIPGRTRMVEKHQGEFAEHPQIFVVHLKRLGKLHCINGTWKEAWGWFQKAIAVNPFEIFKILAWCVIELPYVKYFSPAKHFTKYSPEH